MRVIPPYQAGNNTQKMKNKKIRKKFQRTIHILRLKFSEKIFTKNRDATA